MDKRIKKLCRRAQEGDKAAVRELVGTCYPDIFAYLRRLCPTRQDAEDLTQQTFAKAWSALGSFKNGSDFSTWLHRIAYNACVDWRRKNSKSVECQSDGWWQECAATAPGPFANTQQQQTALRIYQAVDRLDSPKKDVVHLHYYQGLSLRETAAVLNISTATVKYRLREALRVLKKKIDSDQ
jgi:RNA polymerase sigma-70 factor (ECF subfamily)